ncbi:hypothetical protein B296_00021303 [Ensete ventricosum]|uniref:Uncharacterized protein n=1 Tax=Ensete ventricosum TaxID=4639 RepID=A0A426XXI2_ENSVE|nr:hypothetical protein B296_00021303 [Ensete ventricosum]
MDYGGGWHGRGSDTTASSVADLYSGRGNEGSGRNKVDAGSSGKQRGHGSSEGWQPRGRCQQRRRGRWWSTDLKDSERSVANRVVEALEGTAPASRCRSRHVLQMG